MSQIPLNTFKMRLKKFKSIFPFYISEWNKLSKLTKQSQKIKKIKNISMKDIKSNEQWLFSFHDPKGIKLLSRLRLNFGQVTNTNLETTLKTVRALSKAAE